VGKQGELCILYSGSISTTEDSDYNPIAMTATKIGKRKDDSEFQDS
jgi:hypothetical protein